MRSRTDELSFDELKNLIDQTPFYSLITLTGGEPLLKKGFKKILKYILSKRRVNIITNGTLIDDEYIDIFTGGKNLLLVGISIDGLGEVHDKIRGVRGTFNKTVDNISMLLEAKRSKKRKFPLIDIKTVLDPNNLEILDKMYNFCNKLGVDFFTISLPKLSDMQFNPVLQNDFTEEIFRKPEEKYNLDLDFLEKQLRKITSTNGGVKIRYYPGFKNIKSLISYAKGDRKMRDIFLPCYEPWSGVSITANGDVYPCLSLKMGNIKEKSFKEIWNSEKYRIFRNRLKANKLFDSCEGCCYLKES